MSDAKKIALVFGISGGIGSNIYNHLKRKKFKVYGYSRTKELNSDIISENYLKALWYSKIVSCYSRSSSGCSIITSWYSIKPLFQNSFLVVSPVTSACTTFL